MRRACQMMTFIKKLVHRFSLSIFGAMQRSFPRRTNFYKAFTTSIFEGFLNYGGRYVSRELPLFQMAQRIGIFFVTHIYISTTRCQLVGFIFQIHPNSDKNLYRLYMGQLPDKAVPRAHSHFFYLQRSFFLLIRRLILLTLLGLCT